MRKYLAALGVFVGAGCGGGSSPPSQAPAVGTYQSGTRLRAHVLDGGGGATWFFDWHDAELDITCQFALGPDGSWRCLPAGRSTLGYAQVVYLDDACTTPALVAGAAPPAPYALLAEPSCPTEVPVVHVHRVGDPQVETTAVYDLVDGTCAETVLAPEQLLFALPYADLQSFVGARLVQERADDGLDVEVLVADDGALQLGRLFDRERGLACGERGGRCLPLDSEFESSEWFTRADCTEPRYGGWSCPSDGRTDCPGPSHSLATELDPVTCESSYRVRVLESASTPAFGLDDAGMCMAAIFGPCSLYPASGEVALEDFPALDVGKLGSGRLAKLVLSAPGDGRILGVHGASFWDAELGVRCERWHFADQIDRCVPEGLVAVNDFGVVVYADPECSQSLAIGAYQCAPPTYAGQLLQVDNAIYAFYLSAVFAVGERFTGTTTYRRELETGECVSLEGSPGPAWFVGEAVDADARFARLSERTE